MYYKNLENITTLLSMPFIGYSILADGVIYSIVVDFDDGIIITQQIFRKGAYLGYIGHWDNMRFQTPEEALKEVALTLNDCGARFGH